LRVGDATDTETLVQAKAQARWLRELIEDLTGKKLRVQPVVLYPGWFVTKQPSGAEVWVLNPKAMPRFLEHEDTAISPEDARSVAGQFARHLRRS